MSRAAAAWGDAGDPGARFAPDELAALEILRDLPEAQLRWLSEHGVRVGLTAGQRLFSRGDPADALWLVVEGVIQGFELVGGQWLLVATTLPGHVTGMLPFSRMTHYPRHCVAAERATALKLDAAKFPELLQVSAELGRRLVATMADRVRQDVRLEQQAERMVSLGRLSAGLAHELNNPAAAIRRAAARLADHRARLPSLVLRLAQHRIDAQASARLEAARMPAENADRAIRNPLDLAEREEIVLGWLETHGIPEPWDLAATFSDSGLGVAALDDLARVVPPAALDDALAWLAAGMDSDRLVAEIGAAAARISDLVASIKTYSHMDRSVQHRPVDVREGLDNTVVMLAHKLRQKSIRLTRDFADDLPSVPGNAGELNQVWTNLIDNAVDAMGEGGHLLLRAMVTEMWVAVEIRDDGPGIPEAIRSHVFEPFFTTKEVGVGTGLGLGIAQRIVSTHQGHIEVRTGPGGTTMCVRLPIEPAAP